MKTQKNILIAFILNLSFSIIEFIGGIFTGSIAIISDSLHDMIDALSILISYILEKISKKEPNEKYTYGYTRYSVLGALITTLMLIIGSILVIYSAIKRIINPVTINYNGMIIFAIFGVIINFIAAYFTKDGDSLNQKSVNLHMLEDVLGWVIVLIGSILMKFTNINIIDSIMSLLVALFILINAFKNLKSINDLFLIKTPNGISISEIKRHILNIENVEDVHHIHAWSLDGTSSFISMHVVVNKDTSKVKKLINEELKEHGFSHITMQIENSSEKCNEVKCHIEHIQTSNHHHHH